MPRVGRMTEHERRCRALKRTVAAGCRDSECGSLTGLAEALGVNYNTLYARLRDGTISALMMNDIIKILGPETGDRLRKI